MRAAQEKAPPLFGKRVVVTRAERQAGALVQQLEACGAEVIACPTIELAPPESWAELDRALAQLPAYHWLVFTSVNGVEFFLQRLAESGRTSAELAHLRIGAVGQQTAARLCHAGLTVDLVPEYYTAEAFAAAFTEKYAGAASGWRMLLPASASTRAALRPALAPLGVQVEVVTAYQNRLPNLSCAEVIERLSQPPADFLIFTSPSTVNHLARLLAPAAVSLAALLRPTQIACLGPVTAAAARSHNLSVQFQPPEHTAEALVRLLCAASVSA